MGSDCLVSMPLKECNGTDPEMKKGKNKKAAGKYHLEFSGSSIFFWSLALFFLMGWIFVLGILVGRGFLNERLENISELKNSIAKLQKMVKEKESSQKVTEKTPENKPEFAFYKELVDEKEEKAGRRKPGMDQDREPKPEKTEGSKDVEEKKEPTPETVKPAEELPANTTQPEKETPATEKLSSTQVPEAGGSAKKVGHFSLQIASLGTSNQANKLVEQLRNRGYSVFVSKVQIGGKTYYRVHCGPFKDRQEALSFKNSFAAKEKMEGIISKHAVTEETVSGGSKPPARLPSKKPVKISAEGAFTVQIASMNSEEEAKNFVERFVSLGYPAYFLKAEVKGVTRFRVRCGKFDNRKQAEEFREKLAKKEFVIGFVTGVNE